MIDSDFYRNSNLLIQVYFKTLIIGLLLSIIK